MSVIRCVYTAEPNFPATDQHPDAVRYFVAGQWVDAIGGEPTEQEITAVAGGNWRPAAIAQLNLMREKLMGILSSMQLDYLRASLTTNEEACFNAKQLVKVIEQSPTVVAAYDALTGTRAAFDAAVKARWLQIVSSAPAQVKADFNKYGGNTV